MEGPTVLPTGDLPVVRHLDDLAKLVSRQPEKYLRYSRGPRADAGKPSLDYESGQVMPGLSAIPLRPPSWWRRPSTDWLARQVCKYRHLAEGDPDRYAWVASGTIVAHGPDQEPLLDNVSPLSRLHDSLLEEAARRYANVFDQGRTSTDDCDEGVDEQT
jgi:hypothetical protein